MPPTSGSKSAYGAAPAPDPSFRKTWDRATYAAQAADRETADRATARARAEALAAGKKYHPPRPPQSGDDDAAPPPTAETSARTARLDVSSRVGTTSLVPAGAGVGKRGRGAGFYCPDCDLTFKDNLQWVDHLNSRQHLVATGETGLVARVGVEEVRERLALLKRRREEERKEVQDARGGLRERLRGRVEVEEREREEKRRRRREARRSKKGGAGGEDGEDEVRGGIIAAGVGGEEDVARSMGFAGFGSARV